MQFTVQGGLVFGGLNSKNVHKYTIMPMIYYSIIPYGTRSIGPPGSPSQRRKKPDGQRRPDQKQFVRYLRGTGY